jgi:hypothetical protein
LYKLTLEAEKRVRESELSKRELTRRLGTSSSQFYRILDKDNYRKSLDQLVALFFVLDCDLDIRIATTGGTGTGRIKAPTRERGKEVAA